MAHGTLSTPGTPSGGGTSQGKLPASLQIPCKFLQGNVKIFPDLTNIWREWGPGGGLTGIVYRRVCTGLDCDCGERELLLICDQQSRCRVEETPGFITITIQLSRHRLHTFLWPNLTERPLTTKLFIYKLEIFWEIELKCLLYVNSLQEKNLNFWHKRRHILKVTDYQV